MKDRDATRRVRDLAERQHGVVARWQLDSMGIGANLAQGRLEAGIFVPLFQGVYALAHRAIGVDGRRMAAVLASGPGAVLSHGSAMALWGMRGARGPVEVLRHSGGVHRRRPDIRLHQTRALPSSDVTAEAGIPTTTIERTLLDMAGRLDARQLEHALVAADRSGRIRWPDLARLLARGRGRKGVGRLREVAEAIDPRAVETKSPLEVDFLALCREAGLPTPHVNVMVEGYLVDFLWPDKRLIVETDSWAFHSDRLAFESDHDRTVMLTAAGYEVHRTTYRMLLLNPNPLLEIVRDSLNR